MSDLLVAARAGDRDAFTALVTPHLRSLHLHCYRMLGSYADADEALQDTLLRAWRSFGTFADRAPLLHWLYRISTTTCLKALQRRGRQPVLTGEITYLQPYPDVALPDPAAVVEQNETVALAFITALQRLPATQRAVLILRDVLVWSSAEVAELLGTTVAGVNSALQRARGTLQSDQVRVAAPLSEQERDVLDRFLQAWRRCDIPALAAVLREDAILNMPPEEAVFVGRQAIAGFFATVPAGGKLDLVQLVETRANGHPALAAYLPTDDGACRGYGIMVLTVADGQVATITGFPDPEIFRYFGLPGTPPQMSE